MLPDAANPLQARKVLPARLAAPALQDRSVLPDLKARKDRRDRSERKAQPATGARPVRPVPKVRSAPKAHRANQDRKDQRVLPANAANRGCKVLPDRPALPDPRETPVLQQPSVL